MSAYTDSTPCPAPEQHTPCPSDYLAWHEWAERMQATHEQQQCPGCGLWMVWVPRVVGGAS